MKKFIIYILCVSLLLVFTSCNSKLKEFEVFSNDLCVDYDKKGHYIEVENLSNYKDYTIKYEINGKVIENNDIEVFNAGTYNYKISISANGYKTKVLNNTLKINKIKPNFTIDQISNIRYTGEPIYLSFSPKYQLENNLIVEYFDENSEKTLTPPKEISKPNENYKVKVSINELTNYLSTTQELTYRIIAPSFVSQICYKSPVTQEIINFKDNKDKLLKHAITYGNAIDFLDDYLSLAPSFDNFIVDKWIAYDSVKKEEVTLFSCYEYLENIDFVIIYKSI